jgi:histidinol-phosphate aminotransferase
MTMTRTLDRYAEAQGGCELDLSDNTNLWGTPPSAARIVSNATSAGISRYPSAYSNELKAAIARYVKVDAEMIVVGCGSDDVLDSTIRGMAEPGDILVEVSPTFSMVRAFANVSGLRVIDVSRYSASLITSISTIDAPITYLCSPNNPTGETLDLEMIETVAREVSGIVIVDEAYIDFGGESALPLLATCDNLVITRTFSKAFGLAGLRVGYGIGAPALIKRIEAARGPYKVTSVAERVAIEVLDNDIDWVRNTARTARIAREEFTRELEEIGASPIKSQANFVLIPVKHASVVSDDLRDRGIAVRSFSSLESIGDAIRVTVGPRPEMTRFIEALAEVIA